MFGTHIHTQALTHAKKQVKISNSYKKLQMGIFGDKIKDWKGTIFSYKNN